MGTCTKLAAGSPTAADDVDGGGKRDRTADLLHAMQALSQLSYTPEKRRNLKDGQSACQLLFPSMSPRWLPARLAVFRHDIGEDAAAHIELGGKAHELGLGRGHEVVQDTIGHGFMKAA